MPSPPPTSPISPIERAADSFAAELSRWRVERGLTKKQLATQMGFDPSYVSHVEGRRHRPTEDFARRAEAVLSAGGAIWLRFQDYDDLRHSRGVAQPARSDPPVPEQWMPPGTGLIVEQEVATLAFVGDAYRCVIRRSLYNAGTEPVTRYLVRVAVDRYPEDPERSNQHHRDHPLSFEELDLQAWCDDPPAREPMDWRKKHDRDAFKEVWLLFENADGRFPLYPGERVTIEYAYTVGQEKWGRWFQRAIRLPTRRLTVRLDFPAELDAQVWGVQTSLSSEEAPLRTPVSRRTEDDRTWFEWSTDSPTLNARYRLEWRFRATEPPSRSGLNGRHVAAPPDPVVMPESAAVLVPAQRHAPRTPSERMRSVGVVQRGSALLAHPAVPLRLPADADAGRDVVDRLFAALERIEELHIFTKGVGLAAPQIGLAVAIAVVRPPDPAAEPLVLVNPRIVDASPQTDEQYEGCLSFFDVRGLVPRSLRIEVEHADWSGARRLTTFDRGLARLVAHEIDHLEGRLYDERMPPGSSLVPLTEYRETGVPWSY
ncbi:peptide deformylase [Asanoa sp. WMMD1127]|uniref:peptide deformylase n=1 Tax=Asanoa sp. WMMD1127 TaxID=3016107 RepID=UPI002417BBBB|nr:peptide deformylase [Asanoa sp. WMMD1127]MDG4822023.1 peptide deformylase [Asanoa sp. WMMD1127]